MGSEWARDAERQAQMLTRDLSEVGLPKAYKVEYQRREARFALKTRGETLYFAARDFEGTNGPDWLALRLAVLSSAATSARPRAAPRGHDDLTSDGPESF
ncbi:MAG TPA: hypothetical protein VEY09_17955 [Pyrinomonadaceae bacterium]|nr:hypothetical protein [Pyrinomonadaceae bacterium]